MPDSLRQPARQRPKALVAASQAYTPQLFRGAETYRYRAWQDEGWSFRRSLGEFSQAIDWQSRVMSRIRLTAAEVMPGGDEPEPLNEGPAAELMQDFAGGGPGHSAFLKAITPHLLVPGEGWLIAERDDPAIPLSQADWGVYSTDCVQTRGDQFWVRIGEAMWRPLAADALPMRIYEPDPQFPWLATSSTEAAIPIMRRIALIDARIIAMMVSRLAMNGLLLIPQEGTISVPDQYKDAPDPFVALLIDVASRNIANPGNASAAIPIPIKFTGDLIEKWRMMRQEDPLDQWLLQERIDELGRLGDTMGVSRERVTGGMGEQNHWGAALASEEEVNITFSTIAELICGGLTKAYLVPMLRNVGASLVGPNGGRIIAWYDTSELTADVDESDSVVLAYDRLEASGTALRRGLGLSESDKPTPAELEEMAYKKLIGTPELAPSALGELTGAQIPGVGAPGVSPADGPAVVTSPGGPVPSPARPAGAPTPGPGTQPPRPSAPTQAQPMPARMASIRYALENIRPAAPPEDPEPRRPSRFASRGRHRLRR